MLWRKGQCSHICELSIPAKLAYMSKVPPQQPAQLQPGCNCRRGPNTCPVQGRCLTDNIVYKATVTETVSGKKETYTGLTGNRFKERYNGHNTDMRNSKDKNKTKLSGHVWGLKDSDLEIILALLGT